MKVTRKYLVGRQKKLQKGWKSLSREDKGDIARFIKIFGITLITVLFIFNFGIRGLAQVAGFWSIFAGKSGGIQADTTAPPPPTFAPTSSHTKSEKINLSGYAEPAAEVKIFINDVEAGKAITEAGGTFTFADVALNEGKNTITATTTDRSGNVSQKSAELLITLDLKPPELAVTKPTNGQKFSGAAQKQTDVEGTSEPGVTVKVNGIQATTFADGSFKATVTLDPGDYSITVVATDRAGNEKTVTLTVNYSSE